jgi:single-stranded-DNA-specific exonuclease
VALQDLTPAVAAARPALHDRRERGVAGTVAALVASGEPVLVVAADARRRRAQLGDRLGGFALCAWRALERAPDLAAAYAHVVAVDPPATGPQRALLQALAGERAVHLAWGEPERAFAAAVAEREGDLRAPAAAVYRALRDGAPLGAALAAAGPPGLAGRALRALAELGLVDPEQGTVTPAAGRAELERSTTFRTEVARAAESRSLLATRQTRAA